MARLRGPIGTSAFVSADVLAPGVGDLVSIKQLSNTALEVALIGPTQDANGGEFSGVSGVTIGLVIPNPDGSCPAVDDATFDASVIRSTKTELEVTSAGQPVLASVPIPEVGTAYFVVWQFWEES